MTLGFPLKQRLSPHVKGSRVSLILRELLTSHWQDPELSFTFGQIGQKNVDLKVSSLGLPNPRMFSILSFSEKGINSQGYLLLSGILYNKSVVRKLSP